MGIELKDLVVGGYYKGYHAPAPHGLKCFYYVLKVCPASPGHLVLEVLWHYRPPARQATLCWQQALLSGPSTQETLLKTPCRPSALAMEGVPFPVPKPCNPGSPPATAKPLSKSSSQPTAADLAALAKAKQNAGKVAIPENARSPRCVKCNGSNRAVALFQFTSYFCPSCEPE